MGTGKAEFGLLPAVRLDGAVPMLRVIARSDGVANLIKVGVPTAIDLLAVGKDPPKRVAANIFAAGVGDGNFPNKNSLRLGADGIVHDTRDTRILYWILWVGTAVTAIYLMVSR